MTQALWMVAADGRTRLAAGPVDVGPAELLPESITLDGLLAAPAGAIEDALEGSDTAPVPTGAAIAAPVTTQEVWASGVTYLRSRDARMGESDDPDIYDRVYDAERPELFLKATGERVRGPGRPIGIRADSTWDVPEPELAVVANAAGELVAYTIGNDVSSRSIEGENPLYLPQAKTYSGSCALGPCLVPIGHAPGLAALEISVRISRAGKTVYTDSVAATQMKRRPAELVDWLFRALDFPRGAVLLTGTALVPGDEVTLLDGDTVTVAISGLGELTNTVETVGAAQ